MFKVIDVSVHNGDIDFVKVKNDGFDGVIIRAGFGKDAEQADALFDKNYSGALAAGLFTGAYWYSYAKNSSEALCEAQAFYKVIRSKKFSLPIYLDIEESSQAALGKKICSEIAETFCSFMESKGYFIGIYSFDSFFRLLDNKVKDKYSCWVARVENVKPTECQKYDVWQHSWKGSVNGIKGNVDVNLCYKDFPKVISAAGLNCAADKAKYSVTARMSELSKSDAQQIADSCAKLGMSVITSEI